MYNVQSILEDDFKYFVKHFNEMYDEFEEAISEFISQLPSNECRIRLRQMEFRIKASIRYIKNDQDKFEKAFEQIIEHLPKIVDVIEKCSENQANSIPQEYLDKPLARLIRLKSDG